MNRKVPSSVVIIVVLIVVLLTGLLILSSMFMPELMKPTLQGMCLDDQPKEGEVLVYKFAACPIGFMKSNQIFPIRSFRSRIVTLPYPSRRDGPNGEFAQTGSIGTEIYTTEKTSEPLLGVYWEKSQDAYRVEWYSDPFSHGYNDDSLTACYGETDMFVCIGIMNVENTFPITLFDDNSALVWVGWIYRTQTENQLLYEGEVARQ